jgi:ABC-type transporter Mla MlaB component
MLRITVHKNGSATRFMVEGRLAEPWVGELRRCWQTARASQNLVVDLTEVTLVDAEGQALLAEMHLNGTEIRGNGLMTRAMIEEIQKALG